MSPFKRRRGYRGYAVWKNMAARDAEGKSTANSQVSIYRCYDLLSKRQCWNLKKKSMNYLSPSLILCSFFPSWWGPSVHMSPPSSVTVRQRLWLSGPASWPAPSHHPATLVSSQVWALCLLFCSFSTKPPPDAGKVTFNRWLYKHIPWGYFLASYVVPPSPFRLCAQFFDMHDICC